MKDIKFRAWDIKEGRWIKLHGLKFQGNDLLACEWRTVDDKTVEWVYVPEDYILEQYTGLKDKNGKEIYEGDIVKVDWHDQRYKTVTAVVEWVEDAGQWSFGPGATSEVKWSHEVIGNICETPELIQTEKLTS